MRPDRWLATVLFTDIVGSTEKAAELGDQRWRELLQTHHALARRELQRFGGRELNTTGDGLLATFEVPERAIRCACAIRDAVRRLGLEIRAGLHTGEVEMVEKTVGGLAVHIGARVAALAAPGEVLVSGTVRDMAAGSGFEFEDRGAHLLKGVPGEWRLFGVTGAPVRLPVMGFWSRAREARLPRVLMIYLSACVGILWLTLFLRARFGLPGWVFPLAIVLLLIGLVVLSATAWVQSHPLTAARAEREEVPASWELDLKEMRRAVARGRLPHLTWGRSILGGVVAFSLLFGLAGLYVVVQDRGRTFAPEEAVAEGAAPGIAVLPFSVRGPGLDVWREGMVDLLSTNLDGVAGLRTIDSRTVLASWREGVRGPEIPKLETALEIARRTGARYALVGNAVAIGSGVRVTADVYEVEERASLGQATVEGSPDSVFALVDHLSIEILRAILRGEETELPRVNLARVTTASLPALKDYMKGEILFRSGNFEEAIPAYQRAVEADSTFALALYRLALAYGWTEGAQAPLGDEHMGRAARFADRLPERDALLVRCGLAFYQGTLEGIGLLQQAVRKYPDDVEAWYLLGDTYFHFGEQALVEQEESDRAFSRAIALDPSLAPAYIHLVDNAFSRADSARAAELIETYARLAGGTEFDRRGRLAFQLAFADSAGRAAGRAVLDTIQTAPGVASYLYHPRFLVAQEEVQTARRRLPDVTVNVPIGLFFTSFSRGKLGAALERFEDPLIPDGFRAYGIYVMHMEGVPVPVDLLDRELAPGAADSARGQRNLLVGAHAADQARWADHEAALAWLRKDVERSRAEGDSLSARFLDGAAQALEGYGLWKRGRREEALRLIEAAQRRATGWLQRDGANDILRWWLGELSLELGRPREALRYFDSLWLNPYAAYQLAKIHEELGNYDEARKAYELFAVALRDADPELQPMRDEARAAAQRLTSVIRE
jgi:tetratricopeptide (TPR) repeat protein